MKRAINFMIVLFGAAFLSSCSSTGSMIGASGGYGYYDNVYYHGYPSYYANPYLYPGTRIIHNDVIVVPEQNAVRNRDNVRRRETVSPNSRRTVSPTEPNRRIERSTTPTRRGTSVAPSSRSTAPPASRGSSSPNSRRGGN